MPAELVWPGMALPGDQWRDTVPSVDDCSRTAPPPAPSGVAGMHRSRRLVCVGIRSFAFLCGQKHPRHDQDCASDMLRSHRRRLSQGNCLGALRPSAPRWCKREVVKAQECMPQFPRFLPIPPDALTPPHPSSDPPLAFDETAHIRLLYPPGCGEILGVWSRDEVTRFEFEDAGRFGPGLANRFERRFPADGFEVFGEIIG